MFFFYFNPPPWKRSYSHCILYMSIFLSKKSCAKKTLEFYTTVQFHNKNVNVSFYVQVLQTNEYHSCTKNIAVTLCFACWFRLAISLITEVNIFISRPNLYQLSDTNDSNLGVTHSVTQGYYSFSLRHFDPFPGHDLFRSLPPITPSSSRCVPVFFSY